MSMVKSSPKRIWFDNSKSNLQKKVLVTFVLPFLISAFVTGVARWYLQFFCVPKIDAGGR